MTKGGLSQEILFGSIGITEGDSEIEKVMAAYRFNEKYQTKLTDFIEEIDNGREKET